MLSPSLEEFQKAHAILQSQIKPTLLRYSEWLSKELLAEVYLKFEFLQPGRSFKIRGAMNTLLSLSEKPSCVIASSGGNHGIAVAVACNGIGVPCCIILPESTSQHKISVLRELGAEVIVHGIDWDDAHSFGTGLSNKRNGLYIHPFADRAVIIGQGTIVLELVEELPSFDVVIASAGGGGLVSGIALALKALGRKEYVEVISAETFGADCIAQSVRAKKIVELPTITSIARSLGAKKTTPFIFETISRLVDKCVVLSDEQAVSALFQFLDEEKALIEPAASCCIAAAIENRDYLKGKKIVIVVCGANIHLNEVLEWKCINTKTN
jgi:threonine dehydratase